MHILHEEKVKPENTTAILSNKSELEEIHEISENHSKRTISRESEDSAFSTGTENSNESAEDTKLCMEKQKFLAPPICPVISSLTREKEEHLSSEEEDIIIIRRRRKRVPQVVR